MIKILRAIAVSLDLKEDYFIEKHEKQDSSMELKKYPAVLRPKLNTANRILYFILYIYISFSLYILMYY